MHTYGLVDGLYVMFPCGHPRKSSLTASRLALPKKSDVDVNLRDMGGVAENTGRTDVLQLNARFVGRVQGVGFRMTVAEIAESFSVTGRVCNMSDGSVRLVGHGEQAELLRFHQAILQRMGHFVVEHQENWSETTTNCYAHFGIGGDDSL